MLSVNNIYKTFWNQEKLTVLEDVSINLEQNEIIAILGPSGCGKTTLLNIIASLEFADKGSIGTQLSKFPSIGFVMQKDLLLNWRTLYKNITLGIELSNNQNVDPSLINKLLKNFGLRGYENYYPHQLSGGMRKRVSLIRTLITEPQLLLLDEPFSSVDYNTKLELEDHVCNFILQDKRSAIFVTHDIDEAIAVGDKVLIMKNKPSSIVHEIDLGKNNTVRNPIKYRQTEEFSLHYSKILNKFRSVVE